MIRIYIFIVCFLVFQFAVQANNLPANQQVKVGFLTGGPVSDYGWNQAHNDGRLYLEKHMSGKVQTVFAEKVPENSEAARVMEKMIAQGVKIIFCTTYGYLDSALKVAAHHPDVTFMQINRYNDQPKPNVGVYFPYYFETLYATGIVAGRMTKSNKIGFITGHAVPVILADVNALTLGVRSINSNAKIHFVCTNSWNDPTTETECTKALIESGCDIIVPLVDSSLNMCLAADRQKTYSIGTEYDLNNKVPKTWLTGQAWNFGPLYTKIVKSIIDGSWKPNTQYYTAKDNYVILASFGQSVPRGVQDEALGVYQKIKQGKINVFAGPIKDSNGKIRIPGGKIADNHTIEQMNWVVPGVEGYSSK